MKFWPLHFLVLFITSLTFADAGSISGEITIADAKISRVVAVDRQFADIQKVSRTAKDQFVYDASIKPGTGDFLITGLLLGRTYDLIVWTETKDGSSTTRWEGVDMSYHRAIEPTTALTPEDRAWLNEFVTQMPQFYDKCRILWLAADHGHATALVELIRTRDFYADKGGDIVYRTELWYFENLFGGWAKDRNTEKVMARWRGKPGAIETNWQWVPMLGGIAIKADGSSDPIKLNLPAKPDPKRGVVAGKF